QAEDGIRDFHVTGVQTCALPICFREMSLRSVVPRADWKRRRFSRTLSLLSHSVKPRLRTFSPFRRLTPPGRVLKPWTSQGSFASAGTCRIGKGGRAGGWAWAVYR